MSLTIAEALQTVIASLRKQLATAQRAVAGLEAHVESLALAAGENPAPHQAVPLQRAKADLHDSNAVVFHLLRAIELREFDYRRETNPPSTARYRDRLSPEQRNAVDIKIVEEQLKASRRKSNWMMRGSS